MSAQTRYFREGDGRIRDVEWPVQGYVLKVWAWKKHGNGLTDQGAEVEQELQRILSHLNLGADSEQALAALRLSLAQAQAREAKLREALKNLLAEWLAWNPGITGVARTRAEAALSAPTGDEALREMLEAAVRAGMTRAEEHERGAGVHMERTVQWLMDHHGDDLIARVLGGAS